MLCRVLSLLCVGVSPGLVPVKVDVNQCVILSIILQQLLLTYQLKINKSFIHSLDTAKPSRFSRLGVGRVRRRTSVLTCATIVRCLLLLLTLRSSQI